ncbi:MAG: hypothetical protein IKJ16_06130 [Agathobacter sp.]|nr:hypothetical protein [Agathobacter sp.]
MTPNFEHYITRNIRAFYKRRLFSPILYLLILLVLWFVFPLGEMLSPLPIKNASQIEGVYEAKKEYVTVTFEDLTFTGYTTTRFGSTNGYWYYGIKNDVCYIVLLTPFTCEEGNPSIENLSVTCRIVNHPKLYEKLLNELSTDLEWTTEGMANQLPNVFYSEPDYNPITNFVLFLIYFGTLLYTLLTLMRYILYIFFPYLAPACQNLIVFGNPKKQLEEAEEELATLPQLATEDMFITEHYFIMTSPYGNAIVPIQEILWIYKYSTLHKFLWYHFSISYTLHIAANKHMFIQCPKNIKSDIDGIMDYLSEANHDILVGFTEENRLKVEAKQGKPFHIEKWAAVLNKKV